MTLALTLKRTFPLYPSLFVDMANCSLYGLPSSINIKADHLTEKSLEEEKNAAMEKSGWSFNENGAKHI